MERPRIYLKLFHAAPKPSTLTMTRTINRSFASNEESSRLDFHSSNISAAGIPQMPWIRFPVGFYAAPFPPRKSKQPSNGASVSRKEAGSESIRRVYPLEPTNRWSNTRVHFVLVKVHERHYWGDGRERNESEASARFVPPISIKHREESSAGLFIHAKPLENGFGHEFQVHGCS